MSAPEPRQSRAPVAPGLTLAEAVPLVLLTCAEDFERHRARLMLSDDPEGPHGARVALRRFRTALEAFRPVLRRRRAAALLREARDTFRLLGALRDADVLAAGETASDAGSADGEGPRAAEAAEVRAAVRAALAERGAEGFVVRVRQMQAGRGWCRRSKRRRAAGPLKAAAAQALDAAWADVCSHGRNLRRMSVEDRHGFRKDLKALRYLSDFFAPLWPGPRQARFLARLRTLQDALGTLNDLALAEMRLGPEGRSPAQRRAAEAAMAVASREWKLLRDTRRWW